MERYLKIAIKQAEKALKQGEIPVGAVLVKNNKIVAKDYNKRIKFNNPLSHAEINCIIKACKKINDWRLDDYELYVTLEPCEMCKKIIEETRIKKVYYILEKTMKKQRNKTNYYNINIEDNCFKENFQLFFKNLRK